MGADGSPGSAWYGGGDGLGGGGGGRGGSGGGGGGRGGSGGACGGEMTDETHPMTGVTPPSPRPVNLSFMGGVARSCSSKVEEVDVYAACLANQTETTRRPAGAYSSVISAPASHTSSATSASKSGGSRPLRPRSFSSTLISL